MKLTEELKSYIEKYKSSYELSLLTSLSNNSNFYTRVTKGKLNTETKNWKFGEFGNDFTKPIDNVIYKIIHNYYDAVIPTMDDKSEIEIGCQTMKLMLKDCLENESITREEYSVGKERIKEIGEHKTTCGKIMQTYLEPGFGYWLDIRRTELLKNKIITGNRGSVRTMGDLQVLLEKEKQNLTTDDRNMVSLSQVFNINKLGEEDEEIKEVENRLLTGVAALDDYLWGGISKKETMLVVVPSGGGKTTFCTQLTVSMVHQKQNVLFITTEQTADELYPKMFSCACNIEHKKLRDGLMSAFRKNPSDLSEIEKNSILEKLSTIEKYVKVADWKEGDKTIIHDLEKEIIRYEELCGVYPDVVIFDWLGGGISTSVVKESSMLRQLLNNSSLQFSRAARKYNFIGVLTMQADAMQTKNQKFITADMISEAKMVQKDHVLGLGISTLTKNQKEREDSQGVDVYNDIQIMNGFKSRKGPSFSFNVYRDFDYQRFSKPTKLKKRTRMVQFRDKD